MRNSFILLIFAAVLGIVCTLSPPKEETPEPRMLESVGAIASWYGEPFHGRCMTNGLDFDKEELVAAHQTYKFGTKLRVRRGPYSVEVVVMDRGPFIPGRHIDLSEAAARKIHMKHVGVSPVVIDVLEVPARSETYHHQNKRCLKKA